jgi:hypothetical protein
MKILMTGGTGLIGSHFINHFKDYQFTVLTRSINQAKKQLPSHVTLINSLNNLANLDQFDAVINLAGEPINEKRWSEKQKNIIAQSRWQTTQHLTDLFAASQAPPSVFLSGSAAGVYGHRAEEIIDETAEVQAIDYPTSLCVRWEAIAKQAQPFTRVILLRTGIVLAPKGGAMTKLLTPFKLHLGGTMGNGKQYMPWIHYQDTVYAIDHILQHKELSGEVNLVAPHMVTNYEFTRTLAQVLNRIAVLSLPKKLLLYIFGESACLLLDSQRLTPSKLLNSGFKFHFPNLLVAIGDLIAKPENVT